MQICEKKEGISLIKRDLERMERGRKKEVENEEELQEVVNLLRDNYSE